MSIQTFSVIAMGIVQVLFLASLWINTIGVGNSIENLSAYECGLLPIGDARMKFDIQYYVIGIQYQIFDLEIIFLFPLATTMNLLNSLQAFWQVNIFLAIITQGFIYEYNMGALKIVDHEVTSL